MDSNTAIYIIFSIIGVLVAGPILFLLQSCFCFGSAVLRLTAILSQARLALGQRRLTSS